MNRPPPSSELSIAAEHDAAGQYDQAINPLARGTQEGDLGCKTRLGKRVGPRGGAAAVPSGGAGAESRGGPGGCERASVRRRCRNKVPASSTRQPSAGRLKRPPG